MKTITSLFLAAVVGLQAAEIPLLDLSKSSLAEENQISPVASEDALLSENEEFPEQDQRTTASDDMSRSEDVQEAGALQQTPQASENREGRIVGTNRRLRLFLRELAVLQQAAKKAGGEIRVTIEPVNVTTDDLAIALAGMNWFDMKFGAETIVVQSKAEDPYVTKMRDEVTQLEDQRRTLLNDVQSLERLATEWQARIRSYQGYQASTQSQQQPTMQLSYPKTATIAQQQPQPMMTQPQMSYPSSSKTVVFNPEYAQQMSNQQVRSVPRTSVPGEMPASSNPNHGYYAPSAGTQHYSSFGDRAVPQATPPASYNQPQTSYPDSTVVLAPRANW